MGFLLGLSETWLFLDVFLFLVYFSKKMANERQRPYLMENPHIKTTHNRELNAIFRRHSLDSHIKFPFWLERERLLFFTHDI